MDLSLEAYRIIVNNVQSRADLAVLCLVSRAFRRVAERALYNTLYMRQLDRSQRLCETLAGQARIAALVEALDIAVEDERASGDERSLGDHDSGEEEVEEEGEEGDEENTDDSNDEVEETEGEIVAKGDEQMDLETSITSPESGPSGMSTQPVTHQGIWSAISRSLKNMSGLRHLNIFMNGLSSTGKLSWILVGCSFRLKSFHSDMRWDEDLIQFLNGQDEIEDLYIGDYDDGTEHPEETPSTQGMGQELTEAGEITPRAHSSTDAQGEDITSSHRPQLVLSPAALPRLTTLECTFSEAAVALVPGRPISRLKTCFSHMDPAGKKAEMDFLFAALARSSIISLSGTSRVSTSVKSPRTDKKSRQGRISRHGKFVGGWLALDIADAEYVEAFAMQLLRKVVDFTLIGPRPRYGTASLTTMKGTLRYLGTLVLPVGGTELRRLCAVELEISSWDPSPVTLGPVAFRALGNELRLYCPGIVKVVFVSIGSEDVATVGERTTVEYVRGEAVARVDREILNGMNGLGGSEGLWRDT
ncbi:hypothetical protein GYMLUDRAFT_53118 [Collybiopsis luxurians FD-317 M1]|nr:hypothetical protein GYMLUDRAFT_53118 [Collybiopsis luxurians FD-317 M1]